MLLHGAMFIKAIPWCRTYCFKNLVTKIPFQMIKKNTNSQIDEIYVDVSINVLVMTEMKYERQTATLS